MTVSSTTSASPPLNSDQKAAVAVREGAYVIVAVPGSGKTTVITSRVRALIAERVRSEKILTLTFTKEAAINMEQRCGFKHDPAHPQVFRTFHGWALDFVRAELRAFPFRLEHFPLLLPQDQVKILGNIIRHMVKEAEDDLGKVRKIKYRDALSYISRQKRDDKSPTQAALEAQGDYACAYAEAYGKYEAACRDRGMLDFDSIVVEAVRLLERRPEILARWQPQYLQGDESQDNDAIQWHLTQLLGGRGNVFCVGDPNQNMYSWRGSEADGLTTKFIERFPGAKVLPLGVNHRSTKAIVAYCKSIAPMQTAGVEAMRTDNADGVPPVFRRYGSDFDEAEQIITSMKDPENTAILTRTNRQLAIFEEVCGEREIKYKLLGKSGFFTQEEVQNTLAFAQFCTGPTDACIQRIIMSPYEATRYLKKRETFETLTQMQGRPVGARTGKGCKPLVNYLPQYEPTRELWQKLQDARQSVQGKTAENALRSIIARFGILRHYEDDDNTPDNHPGDNVRSLLRMSEKCGTLLEFVFKCLRAKQAARSNVKRLTLSTIHQSKGKEWNSVYVAGVNQDILPHKNGELEEEKRIYFVACSRAAKDLYVSCVGPASAFIKGQVPVLNHMTEEVELLEGMHRLAQEVDNG